MLTLKVGDITTEDVDVIVNAANTQLKGGGGVDGAIHRAAGPSVMEECRQFDGCPTGTAVMTNAGNLSMKKIIHTVGPVWNGGNKNEEVLLRGAYEMSFQLAKGEGLKKIAFPAISTGVYRYPKREAAKIALSVGMRYEKDFEEIRYVCFSIEDLKIYREVFEEVTSLP